MFFYYLYSRIYFFIEMTTDVIFAVHVIAIVSVSLSGIFILAVRGIVKPIVFMPMYHLATMIVLLVNLFQTYNTPYYGHLLWNPLHLFSLPLIYPMLFAYIFNFIRPGSVGLGYWLKAYIPLAALLLLHFTLSAINGALPVFTSYAEMRGYLSSAGLWVCFATVVFYVVELTVYAARTVTFLRQHTRDLKSNFSYTEGNTLSWMWWNLVLSLLKALSVLLMILVEGNLTNIICIIVLAAEAAMTTIWVLRQKDLYDESSPEEESSLEIVFERNSIGSERQTEKYKKLKKTLLSLLEKDEIFKDPELNSEKVRAMLATNSSYLSRIINQDMDTSFYQLINTYRLNKSTEMMKEARHQTIPLSNIAEICGFKSLSAFSVLFKQTYGKTPTEWRKEQWDVCV